MIDAFSLFRFDLGEITGGHHDDQHEEDEDDHDIEAELAANLDLIRDAPPIGTLATEALCFNLTLVKVLLHSLLTDARTPRAVSERAAWLIWAVGIDCTSLNTLDDRRAHITRAATRQALKAVVTVVIGLLLPLVADGARHAAPLTTAEGRPIALGIV